MSKKIFLEGRHDGYTPEQCRRTLTVKELIDILDCYDEDTEIYLINDGGYTFGSIDENSIVDDIEEED